MVRFEENKLVIEIADPYPVEAWMDIHAGICDVVRNVKQENIVEGNYFAVIDFLREMVPDYDNAVKMMESDTKTTSHEQQ